MAQVLVTIEYRNLEAVHDHMSKRLHVSGECTVRGGGFAVEIAPLSDPQHGGINTRMLTLALNVIPTGESPSKQVLDYHQPWSDDVPFTEVDFRVESPTTATQPPTLTITDVQ